MRDNSFYNGKTKKKVFWWEEIGDNFLLLYFYVVNEQASDNLFNNEGSSVYFVRESYIVYEAGY